MVQPTIPMNKDNSLEEVLSEEMNKILAEEIDWELLSDMMTSVGWTKVDLHPVDRYEAIDIDLWIEDNCTGKHMRRSRAYVFEKQQDAEWFILKWK